LTHAALQPGKPLAVDLLLPKTGEGASATNKDYTRGTLHELVSVMIEERIEVFVCAVGVAPKPVVERLHAAGILCMNLVGSVRHVKHCVASGVDIICAQGMEGGGHTGHVSTMVLLPQVVDACRASGTLVLAAGGIMDGRGIAAALAMGADGVWMGTRFIAAKEANISVEYRHRLFEASSDDTTSTRVFTGRNLRCLSSSYIDAWNTKRVHERDDLLGKGVIPFEYDKAKGNIRSDSQLGWWWGMNFEDQADCLFRNPEHLPLEVDLRKMDYIPVACGQGVGVLNKTESTAEIVSTLVQELDAALKGVVHLSRL